MSDKTVLHVEKNTMQGDENAGFISAPGAPSALCAKTQACIVMHIKGRRCVLFDLNMTDISFQLHLVNR